MSAWTNYYVRVGKPYIRADIALYPHEQDDVSVWTDDMCVWI